RPPPAPPPTAALCPRLRIDDLARAARADRNRDPAEDADHLEVGRGQASLVFQQDFGQEAKENGRADEACRGRGEKDDQVAPMAAAGQQVADTAEPGPKR